MSRMIPLASCSKILISNSFQNMNERHRPETDYQTVSWRFCAPSACSCRRLGSRRCLSRSAVGHRPTTETRLNRRPLDRTSTKSFTTLHLDDCVRGAQRKPEGYQRLARSSPFRCYRYHTKPEDFG